MTTPSLTRRTILTGTLGMMAGGFCVADAEGDASEISEEKKPRRPREKREEPWKYIALDPQKCGQRVFDSYDVTRGCMYSMVKNAMLEYVEALEKENPEQAETCRQFPFLMLSYGKSGVGELKSLCGGINGGAMFMGLFVSDMAELGAMIQKLGEYVETTPLPEFSPADDQRPNFPQAVSHSMLCKDNIAAWLALDDSEEHRLQRIERCKRHAASCLAKAVCLLNEYFSCGESHENAG